MQFRWFAEKKPKTHSKMACGNFTSRDVSKTNIQGRLHQVVAQLFGNTFLATRNSKSLNARRRNICKYQRISIK